MFSSLKRCCHHPTRSISKIFHKGQTLPAVPIWPQDFKIGPTCNITQEEKLFLFNKIQQFEKELNKFKIEMSMMNKKILNVDDHLWR